MSRPIYTSFAWAYDLVVPSPAPPQPDEAARLLAGRTTIVDVGCGTGRHAAFLSQAGFTVLGIDASEQMLAVARERAPDAEFVVADLFVWRPAAPVDGVLCRGVLNEYTEDADRQRGVDSLFEMLRPGGLLVLSVREVEKTRARYNREPVVTRSEEGVYFRSEARFLGDKVVVDETVSSEDARAEHHFEMRPWSLSELDERRQRASRVWSGGSRATGSWRRACVESGAVSLPWVLRFGLAPSGDRRRDRATTVGSGVRALVLCSA